MTRDHLLSTQPRAGRTKPIQRNHLEARLRKMHPQQTGYSVIDGRCGILAQPRPVSKLHAVSVENHQWSSLTQAARIKKPEIRES
jgi:hypothetical protein